MIDILNKILNVSCEELNALNANFINQYNFHHNVGYYFGQSANQEHYRLLMYIAGLFNNNHQWGKPEFFLRIINENSLNKH
jgi:hypothetical protein